MEHRFLHPRRCARVGMAILSVAMGSCGSDLDSHESAVVSQARSTADSAVQGASEQRSGQLDASQDGLDASGAGAVPTLPVVADAAAVIWDSAQPDAGGASESDGSDCAEPSCDECRNGETRCHVESRSVQTCSQAGRWEHTLLCRAQDQVCKLDQGTAWCVDLQDYFVGNSDADLNWQVVSSNDLLYAQRVTVTSATTLRGLYLRSAVLAGACDMALYADEQGHPGKWIASTLNVPIDTSPSGMAVASRVELAAGTVYWITASCGRGDGPAQLYQIARAGEEAYTVPFAWGQLPPSTFPMSEATREPDRAYSIFAKVRAITSP